MKWVEIITLRSPGNINRELVGELLKSVGAFEEENEITARIIEIKIYHHPVVESDLSIHIYWSSKQGSQHKSPIGLRVASVLKPLGLLNHSVWVETTAQEINRRAEFSADIK